MFLPPNPKYDPSQPSVSISSCGDFICNVPHAFPVTIPGVPAEAFSPEHFKESKTAPEPAPGSTQAACPSEKSGDEGAVIKKAEDDDALHRLHQEAVKQRQQQRKHDLLKLYGGNKHMVKSMMAMKHPEHCPVCLASRGRACKYFEYVKRHGQE